LLISKPLLIKVLDLNYELPMFKKIIIMKKEEFVLNFANQFDETDASEITINTAFKALEEWSSLLSLSIIAMCDEEYDVKIKGDDIRNAVTVEDLYNVVIDRKQ